MSLTAEQQDALAKNADEERWILFRQIIAEGRLNLERMRFLGVLATRLPPPFESPFTEYVYFESCAHDANPVHCLKCTQEANVEF